MNGYESVSERVRRLAVEHNVRYVRGKLDEFADAVTQLADNVLPAADETMDLLVALHRCNVISGAENMALALQHIRERAI